MKQEDKDLLLRDLSARLPYGVRCQWKNWSHSIGITSIAVDPKYPNDVCINPHIYADELHLLKPYLRNMSNMTKEEKEELLEIVRKESDIVCKQLKNNDCGIKEGKYHFNTVLELDFLLSHHFDYRGLIEKGLALEAPEGMYSLNK